MDPIDQRRIRFVAGFAVYFAFLWFFWNTPVVFPLKIFVVFLHEISHGIAAIATGGSIERIVITPNEGGLCECSGRAFLTLPAGYLGSLAWGVVILALARDRSNWTRVVTASIGALVVATTVLFVRNQFGLVFGLGFGIALVLVGRFLSVGINAIILRVIGLTSCLYAILDIKSDIIDRPELQSDARMLAELTGIPTLVWGIVWITIALLVTWKALRYLLRRAERTSS